MYSRKENGQNDRLFRLGFFLHFFLSNQLNWSWHLAASDILLDYVKSARATIELDIRTVQPFSVLAFFKLLKTRKNWRLRRHFCSLRLPFTKAWVDLLIFSIKNWARYSRLRPLFPPRLETLTRDSKYMISTGF